MDPDQDELIGALIARRMGLSDQEDEARIRQAGPQAEELLRRLEEVLAPLDTWRVPDPPRGLNERIMSRIQAVEETISFEEAAVAREPDASVARGGGWYFSIRDLVAAAAVITLLIGLFVPGYRNARRRMERIACRDNMSKIYAGLASFANEHQGRLPYAGQPPARNWLAPRQGTGGPGPNAGHMYMLIKKGYLSQPRYFVCPSRPDDLPMEAADPSRLSNFPRRANVSYSMQHMGGRYRLTVNVDPNMVILSDANPLFDGDVVRALLNGNLNRLNSQVHGQGAGQNVLYLSGRAVFAKAPTVGVGGDNIWQAGNLTEYDGTETPQFLTDTFLVP